MLLVPGPVRRGRSLTAVCGRYAIRQGLLVTGVWWAQDESPDRPPVAAHELPITLNQIHR